MPDLFEDFNKIFKKDLIPMLVKYFKDPNNKINDNLNDLINDPQALVTGFFENFSKNKDYYNNQKSCKDIENLTDIDPIVDIEYDELFKRLILIEENIIHIEKILKDKN
tara:strand:- start:18 stop:344 length:327 start_codon:yes stop_codon:yes gene_type:complete